MNKLVTDFCFDRKHLSDFGAMLATINGTSVFKTVPGCNISFNVTQNANQRFLRTSSSYSEVLTTSFQIFKKNCKSLDDSYFDIYEVRQIMKWLNTENYKRMEFLSDDFIGIYFMGYCNVQKITNLDRCVGFDVTFTCDSSFGYHDQILKRTIATANSEVTIYLDNDRNGYIYPTIKVIMKESGKLEITNMDESSRPLIVNNCKLDDVVYIDCSNKVIESSNSLHDLPDSFNFAFIRFDYNDLDRKKFLKFNKKCEVEITITELRKVGLF